MKKQKAAIFGGSFDPPHIGHLQIIKSALEKLDIDKLIVVPAHLSPFKKGHSAPPELRLKWLKAVTADNPKVEVSDYEIRKGSKSYTIDTVRHFKHFFGTIYLIIGADNLKTLKKWHRYEELDKMVKWVVATRSDLYVPKRFIRLDVDIPISSTELRENIDPKWIPEPIRQEVVRYYTKKQESS